MNPNEAALSAVFFTKSWRIVNGMSPFANNGTNGSGSEVRTPNIGFASDLCIRKNVVRGATIHDAGVPFTKEDRPAVPFPVHPNYEAKAWRKLQSNRSTGDVIFWNLHG